MQLKKAQHKNTIQIKLNGFSLIELLIVIVILSILVSITVPTFSATLDRWRLNTTTRSIEESFQRMKHYSLNHGVELVICGTQDYSTCSKDWSQGYMLFRDDNQNRKKDDHEIMLEKKILDANEYRITSNHPRYFRTWVTGRIASQAGTLSICHDKNSLQYSSKVVIARTGRVRTSFEKIDCSE